VEEVESIYDHNEGHTTWSQNLVFSRYADHKTSHPLDFRLIDKDGQSKIALAKQFTDHAETASVPPGERNSGIVSSERSS
jgi:hypothetical protein